MGVRGLHSYISANHFLNPFELHDTNLVIDGDSLCVQLYQSSQRKTYLFGGNYDHFFHAVTDFFELLQKCNVTPYVLLDGGYEKYKLRTAKERMLVRLQSVKKGLLDTSQLVLPLMVREVFIEALRVANIKHMRCLFEADNEVASLAQKLDCPLLSYDSDFYIHNVKYIPFVTMARKVSRKEVVQNVPVRGTTGRKRCATAGEQGKGNELSRGMYNYLDCHLYTIENLTGSMRKLQKEMLPLFAVLLGNDQIEQDVLSAFYSAIKVHKDHQAIHKQQRWIANTLGWLQQKSLQSAIETILNHVSVRLREKVQREIHTAMLGYRCSECVSFDYFRFKAMDHLLIEKNESNVPKNAVYIETNTLSEKNEKIAPVGENDKVCDMEEEADDFSTQQDDDKISPQEEQQVESLSSREFVWEPWFLDMYRSAHVPRFFVDLYRFKRYLNLPQMEDISKQDSNTISYPILRHIFTLLMFSKKSTNFNYFTRCVNMTHFRYCKFTDVKLPESVIYDPYEHKNLPLLQLLFAEFSNCEQIFESINTIPNNLQAYFLSIVYWAKQCLDVTIAHVYALVISILQLQIIDTRLQTRSRDIKVFEQMHKTQLGALRCTYENPSPPEIAPSELVFNKDIYNVLSNYITEPELLFTYAKLLPYFSSATISTTLDRSALHTFAELQSVIYNFNALLPLLRNPFDGVCMHECYNGLFIYNLYQTLQLCRNAGDIVKTTCFEHSSTLAVLCQLMVDFVLQLVPELADRTLVVQSKRKTNVQGRKKASKNMNNPVNNDCIEEKSDSASEQEDESDFYDVNNHFSRLMLGK